MKKNMIIACILILVIFATISCSSITKGYTNEIKDFNANSNFELKLAEEEKNIEKEKFKRVEGFGGFKLESSDSLTSYSISGYPDCLDDYKVTGLQTQDSKYEVYEISVGDNVENAIIILESRKYKKDAEASNEERLVYRNGKVKIFISAKDSKISSLGVYLEVTNKKGVQF